MYWANKETIQFVNMNKLKKLKFIMELIIYHQPATTQPPPLISNKSNN